MTGRNRILRELGAVFLWALLLFAHPAAAQTITNTARAGWIFEGTAKSGVSNTVTIEVQAPRLDLDTYRPSPGGDTILTYNPSTCGTGQIDLPSAALRGSSAGLDLTSTYRVGENIVFRLASADANRDPGTLDTLRATITSTAGDREEITIFETDLDSGVFVGAIPTHRIPPAPTSGDCRLGGQDEDTATISVIDSSDQTIATTVVNLLADPFGTVFDSQTGVPVSGAKISIVDAVTGQPATVFAPDGITPWPSSVVSGESITDAAGEIYEIGAGEFWFPLMPPGRFRLVIEPPAPYTAPSLRTSGELAGLTSPDGQTFQVSDGSYGNAFALSSPAAVQIDIPVDAPNVAVTLDKAVSREFATPGDVVFYTVTARNPDQSRPKRNVTIVDTPSPWLRLRPDSVRINGERAEDSITISSNGRVLTIALDQIAPAGTARITYAMSVRGNAPEGNAENVAEATDDRDSRVIASANLRIERDAIGQRMTIIGRITEGSCTLDGDRVGIPGIRVMLEDGSFAVTDAEGRYHFEGVRPGTHVVQAQSQTLPEGGEFVDCSRSTRNAGSAFSRFAIGQGGSLVVADFYARLPDGWTPVVEMPGTEILDDVAAAGGDTDWLAMGDGPTEFLFPEVGHNPRAPAVRVAIRHEVGERVELSANGQPVGPLTFDGAESSADRSFAVSLWRGIPLRDERTELTAIVRNADSEIVAELSRLVEYAAGPVRAQLVPEQSLLVADGANRPVIAVRLTDRRGLPVRAGVSGTVAVNAPYESAAALERLQVEQLGSPLGGTPTWTVHGDEGIALIELAPTLVSGPLKVDFEFRDRETVRRQEIESWIVPGDQEWTVVGLAEGTAGSRSVADAMEMNGQFDSDLGEDARVAFYARGRVIGSVLLTVAYDSAGNDTERELLGFIDPNAYYTVFADRSSRRFDAASRDKLYVRIETEAFYAIYGDILTGFDQTQLARYERAVTGFQAEGRFGKFHVQVFAAETDTRFRRDEIQGGGISGPYRLSTRSIVPNSERVTIEVRDRFRSELLVESRELVRFVDYDIDLLSGTIRFVEPVLSRDGNLDPQIIVIEYEADELASTGDWNGGLRADVTVADGALRIGASALSDGDDTQRTRILGADARLRLDGSTEVRAEVGASRREDATSTAWLVEAEHFTGNIDIIAYARSIDAEYGTGQQSIAERGRRKIGVDARYRFSEDLSIDSSVWRDDSLTDARRRDAVKLQGQYRDGSSDYRLGIAHFSDRLADLSTAGSTVLEAGVTQRLFDNKLELGLSSSLPLDDAESVDLPARHRIDARYAITTDIRAVGTFEIADGEELSARTLRAGLETAPWSGARLTGSLGQQDISEFGSRSFAAFGLSQSATVSPSLTLSATLDGSRTLSGDDPGAVINEQHPFASGGHLGQDGSLFEDFTAVTAGAAWRRDAWSATARGEYRDGEFADRYGISAAAIRQFGNGRVFGGGMTWTRADDETGRTTAIFDGALSLAQRPDDAEFAFLGKLEYRSDEITGAVAGETGPAGRTALLVDGDAASRRLIASLSTNWSPRDLIDIDDSIDEEQLVQRHEVGIFVGARYNFDRFEGIELDGFSGVIGLDARVGIGDRFEIGSAATVRRGFTDGTTDFAVGPYIGFVPTDNVLLTLGYNVSGFRDRDFEDARETRRGLFASIRAKFDANSFSFLGLGR